MQRHHQIIYCDERKEILIKLDKIPYIWENAHDSIIVSLNKIILPINGTDAIRGVSTEFIMQYNSENIMQSICGIICITNHLGNFKITDIVQIEYDVEIWSFKESVKKIKKRKS